MRLTHYAVHRRLAATAILAALVVLGVYGFLRLPVDFLPSITYPMIKVHIWWRGATPEEIDKSVADVIERQMATVDGLDYIESSSIEGMYTLLANFEYGVDVDVAYQDALAAMARAARSLPRDMDPPVVIKADPSQLPIAQITVASNQWDLVRLRTWTEEWLQDQMLAVPGVAGTEVVGGLKREIRIHLDPGAMEKYGLTLAGVLKRLREENVEQFGGRVTAGPKEIIARTMGEYKSIEEIESVALRRDGLSIVTLGDIATVEDSHEDVRVITRLGGNPCIKLSVLKQADANTVEVAQAVSRRLDAVADSLPGGIRLGIVENQADYVSAALNGVRNAALEAAVLVILIVWLFLGSWRQVAVIVLALPLTLILNFGLMKLAGFSLNIFSLGGLVIAIGVLVDNSIIVIETITRRRQDHPEESVKESAVNASREIGPAIVAATLSFIALFVPFLLVPGLVSLLFRELILVIAGIVVISLAMAVTMTPMFSSVILGRSDLNASKTRFERIFEFIANAYERILARAITHRWLVLLIFVVVALLAVKMSKQLGSEFLPKMDDGRIMVKLKMPTGTSVAETDRVLASLERKLADDHRIETLFTLSGGKVWGLYTYEIANEGELNIQLVPRDKRRLTTKKYLKELRSMLKKIPVPGGKLIAKQMKVKGIRKLGDADIEAEIKGQDIETLYKLAAKTARAMKKLDHFTNVYVSMDMTKPEYQVVVDRKRAAQLGVSVSDVSETLRSLLTGAVATRFRDGDEYYNIRALIPARDISSKRDIENLLLDRDQGGTLRLSDVASVHSAVGPVEIVRKDQIKQVIVRGDASGVSVGQALSELQSAISGVGMPSGYEVSYGGQAQMMKDMKQTLLLITLFAVFFSFIVLTVQFDSLRLPAIILVSVPFCLAGLVFIMLWTSLPLGATVIIGVLVVIAATVNDGVLLLTFANELRTSESLEATVAVVKAAKIRLRPRVMTTASVLFGFIPLALALEEGGDMLQPMAVAAIGGLMMEILVALFLMPCLYVLVSGKSKCQVFEDNLKVTSDTQAWP